VKPYPLQGLKILIPRVGIEAAESSEIIRELGGEPIPLNVLNIQYNSEELEKLDKILNSINTYDWVVFTSRNGVRIFVERLRGLAIKPNQIRCKFAAVGPSTGLELMNNGLTVSFKPSKYLTDALSSEIPDIEEKRVLLIRSSNADEKMRTDLTLRGAYVEEVRPYRVSPVQEINLEQRFDAVILTSPSVVDAIHRSMKIKEEIGGGALVCCIGPVTSNAALKRGLRVDLVAEEHTFRGAVKAIVEWVLSNAGRPKNC